MKKVIIYICLTAFFFGTMEVSLKVAGSSLDPLQITFLRFLAGGALLVPFAVQERKHLDLAPIRRGDWLWFVLMGAVNVCFSMTLYQVSLNYLNASTGAVLLCCNPLFTMIFAHIMTKDDKIDRRKIVSMSLGLVGILLMVRPWDVQEGNTLHGALIMLTAAAGFGLYTVLGGKTVARTGVFTQTAASFLLGCAALLPVLLLTGRPVFEGAAENLPLIAYTSICVTGIGYLCYFLAIKNSSATTASIVFFLKPVVAPVFAVLILHEAIEWNMLCGIALILFSSGIMIWGRRRAA